MPKIPKKRGEDVEHGRRIPRRRSKKTKQARANFDRSQAYLIDDAIAILKRPEVNFARFDQTIEVVLRLGVDPRKSEQLVRGALVLPHGTGKSSRVLVFAKGEKATEAQEAGADFVGGEELVEKIQTENWLEFDKAIATPDMMRHVGRIGKLLGPRGLMPSPKVGTVTFEVGSAVREQKAGKIEFRVDKAGIVHAPIGKISFSVQQIRENFQSLIDIVMRQKPPTAKGVYMRKANVCLTQSPSVRLDVSSF